jgi:hypothetical protein
MERISGEVERVLGRTSGGQGLALSEITRVWPVAVGDTVARHAWPLRVSRDGTLHVATTSATWAFELDRLSPEIEKKLGGLLGDSVPSGLRFRVGPVPEPGGLGAGGGVVTPAPTGPASSPESDAAAAAVSSAIEDPELREIVARAARASLSRARVRPPFLVD